MNKKSWQIYTEKKKKIDPTVHCTEGIIFLVFFTYGEKKTTDLEFIRTARGLISLSFRCGVKIVNRIEVPQFVNFSCTRSHVSGSLAKIRREYPLQPELLKREINRSEIKKHNYIELRDV